MNAPVMACVGKSKSGGWYARHETNHTILRKSEHPTGGFRTKKAAKRLAAKIARENGQPSTSPAQIGECGT